MTLSAGTRLGPYEILSPLGAGGMGEVYRAKDARLGREVAIKVLPASFSADPDRLRRFEQEVKAAGVLNHPNITAVYDTGQQDGAPYVVQELLEGETLRSLLAGGRLSAKRAIEYALQIAHGLSAAHEKGIVHRDLKPENLFVTRNGQVKILDFGLAKLTRSEPRIGPDSKLPTETAGTEPGVVMGTLGYMSPEQVRGQPVDTRSDIFSFGAILYEMLSGRRAFRGDSAADTMSAILKEDPPDLSVTNQSSSPGLERIVRHCLEKNPEQRFHSAHDLAFDLETLTGISGAAATTNAEPARRRRRIPFWALAAATFIVAITLAVGVVLGNRSLRSGSERAPSFSLTLSFPVDAAPSTFNTNPLALSPDGKTLVYAGSKLFVRPLDRDEIRPIPGTEGGNLPFFSPDGLWVGFFAEKKLKKVALAGGSPITLCDAPNPREGSWGADGTIVFVPSPSAGLQRIPASGGEVKAVTTPDVGKGEMHYFPKILPDGENVLFQIVHGGPQVRQAATVSLRTGEQRVILEDACSPRFLPTGHVVFIRGGLLLAAPFSLQRLETTGPPAPLLEDLVTNRYFKNQAELAYSQGGTLVYVPRRQLQRTLVWVDRKGAVEQVPFPPGGYRNVALSPDGGRLAAISIGRAEEQSLLFGDVARWTLTRATAEGSFSLLTWARDGKRIAYGFSPEGKTLPSVFWQSADGSAPAELLTSATALQVSEEPTSFSPDGSVLLLRTYNYTYTSSADTHWEVYALSLTGERKLRPFLQTKLDVFRARFSPDGRWVAYESVVDPHKSPDELGRLEVYVQPYPGPGPSWQVSTEGGRYPLWSRSGREVFFWQKDKLMAVDVEIKPTFRAGQPRMLFKGDFLDYDVAPDGKRFLMINPDPAESGPAHVKVVLNWFEEVKRRAPGAK